MLITASEARNLANHQQDNESTDFFQKNQESNEILLTFIYEEIRISSERGHYYLSIPMEKVRSFYNLEPNQSLPVGFDALVHVVFTDLENNGFKLREGDNLIIDWSGR
jgi:hypothetical protein